jgi:CBS domain-containing protein
MICPVCGFENLTGAEVCDNCGADLSGTGIPQPTMTFHGRLLGEHLDDLGAPPPFTVHPDALVGDAIARMHADEIDCVLVTNGDGRLVGIFTDRDAVVKFAGKPLDSAQIGEYMTPDPVVLRHDDPIALAINKMAVGGFRHIPIIQDGRPTGVVTARDVFHHLAEILG